MNLTGAARLVCHPFFLCLTKQQRSLPVLLACATLDAAVHTVAHAVVHAAS